MGKGFGFRGFRFRISDFRFRISGFRFRVPGFRVRVLGFELRVSGFGLQVSGSGFRISVCRVSNFGFGFSGFGFWAWGFGRGVWGLGFGVSVGLGSGLWVAPDGADSGHHEQAPTPLFEKNYFTKMCRSSEAGSYLRLVEFVCHSTLGVRVIKKKKTERYSHTKS